GAARGRAAAHATAARAAGRAARRAGGAGGRRRRDAAPGLAGPAGARRAVRGDRVGADAGHRGAGAREVAGRRGLADDGARADAEAAHALVRLGAEVAVVAGRTVCLGGVGAEAALGVAGAGDVAAVERGAHLRARPGADAGL